MKAIRKALAFALTVGMMFSVVLPLSVSAEDMTYGGEIVVKNEDGTNLYTGTDFYDAVAALNTATGAATVTFNGNVETAYGFDIKVPCKVIGNGYTLRYIGNSYAVSAYGRAYLTADSSDDTQFTPVNIEDIVIDSESGGITYYPGADVTLDNVCMTAKGNSFFAASAGAVKITVNSGTYTQTAAVSMAEVKSAQIFTVNGGTFSQTANYRMFTVSGTGTLNINGGSFTVSNNGGDVIRVGDTAVVNIAGGVLISQSGSFISFPNATSEIKPTVNIYNGYMYGKIQVFSVATSRDNSNVKADVYIYGGTIVSGSRTWARAGAIKLYIYGGELIAKGKASSDGKTIFTDGNVQICNVSGCRIGIPVEHTVFSSKNDDLIKAYTNYDSKTGYPWTTVGDLKYIGGNGFALKDGAAVRLVNDGYGHGIRFTSVFTADAIARIDSLKDGNTKLTYGTVIIPTAVLTSVNAYTVAGLEGAGLKARSETLPSGYDFAAIDSTTEETDRETGNVTVRCSLVGLQSVSAKFSAIPYVKYVKNGAEVYVYGEVYNETTDSRSMAEVAFAALKDVRDAEDTSKGYGVQIKEAYTVTYGDESVTVEVGKWSPYTLAQRAILESYLAN